MTLGEAKTNLYHLLDETDPSADLKNKLNSLYNRAVREVAYYYPITVMSVSDENGSLERREILPAEITADTDDTFRLQTQDEALNAVQYLVAAWIMQPEYDQRYYQNFYSMYQGALANLTARGSGITAVVKVSDLDV